MAVGLGGVIAWYVEKTLHMDPSESAYSVSDGVIVYWDAVLMGRSRPTQTEIDSWTLPANKYYQRRIITRQADTDYEAINAINGDTIGMFKDELLMDIVANRLSPTANPLNTSQTNRRNQMAAIRQSHRQKMLAIDAATTVAAVDAVVWP